MIQTPFTRVFLVCQLSILINRFLYKNIFYLNGGPGGSRTRVRSSLSLSHSQAWLVFTPQTNKCRRFIHIAYRPVAMSGLIFTTCLLFCLNWIDGFKRSPD